MDGPKYIIRIIRGNTLAANIPLYIYTLSFYHIVSLFKAKKQLEVIRFLDHTVCVFLLKNVKMWLRIPLNGPRPRLREEKGETLDSAEQPQSCQCFVNKFVIFVLN